MKKSFVENICPIYQNALGKVCISMELAEIEEQKINILKKFCEKYFMLPHFWEIRYRKSNNKCHGWKNFESTVNIQPKQLPEKNNTKHILDYYFKKFHGNYFNPKNLEWDPEIDLSLLFTSRDYDETVKRIENALNFPHQNLEAFYEAYANYGAKPLSKSEKKNYEKCLKLLKKLEAAGDDDEKWLKCIKKLENQEAVIANIELRLGQKSSAVNKGIWKYYIEYLRPRNSEAMLEEVYLRYCRFFISDKEMVEEYRAEIERIRKLEKHGVTVFWIDTIEWEMDFGDLKTAYLLLKTAYTDVTKKSDFLKLTEKQPFFNNLYDCKKKMIKFEAEKFPFKESSEDDENYETPAKKSRMQKVFFKKSESYQRLSLPTFMAKYMTKNASAQSLSKLHQTSKYFYSLRSIPICHRLVIERSVKPRNIQQCLFLQNSSKILENHKIWISHSLVYAAWPWDIHMKRINISTFISKIYKCDASDITLCHQHLTVKELEFFVSSGKVKHFYCASTRIFDENKNKFLQFSAVKRLIESYGNELETFKMHPLRSAQCDTIPYFIYHGIF